MFQRIGNYYFRHWIMSITIIVFLMIVVSVVYFIRRASLADSWNISCNGTCKGIICSLLNYDSSSKFGLRAANGATCCAIVK
jgi:hypothetical protein